MSDLPGFTISFDAPPPPKKELVSFDDNGSWGGVNQTPQRKTRLNAKAPSRTKKSTVSKPQPQLSARMVQTVSHQKSPVPPEAFSTTSIQPEFSYHEDVSNSANLHGGPWSELDTSFDFGFEMDIDTSPVVVDSEGGKRSSGATLNEEAYEVFAEAVQAEECGFWRLSKTLFIANGWDIRTNMSTPLWYHLTRVRTAIGEEIACFCPEAKSCDDCLHIRFLQNHGNERFPCEPDASSEEDRTILFSRYRVNIANEAEEESDMVFQNLFSVYSPGLSASAKTRVVVEHEGNNLGSGHWTCAKHPRILNCEHIIAARDCLQQQIKRDESAQDTLVERDSFLYDDTRVKQAAKSESVSYQSIPPALWARLPSDPDPPIRTLLETPPTVLSLGPTSSCCCRPGSRASYDPSKQSKVVDCVVYGITRMWKTTIQIQKCVVCKHRYVGPDCREIGIFNWNNRCLFMHDLLEDYTCSYTTSETPIHAWVLTISRRYQSHGAVFVGEKRFSAVWFAYARLLDLNNDMRCLKCGPTPRSTIWDGVTLSYTRKNILPSLRPPTTIHANAPHRLGTRYPVNPQCIQDKDLRKSIRLIFSGSPLNHQITLFAEFSEEQDDTPRGTWATKTNLELSVKRKADLAMRVRIDAILPATQKLKEINQALGLLFERCFGTDALQAGKTPVIYRRLFQQLAAEESVLQLMTRPVLFNMEIFLKNPGVETLRHLTMFPALYAVMGHELKTGIRPDMIDTCKWLLLRGWTVLLGMLTTSVSGVKDVKPEDVGHWTATGSYYGMPQIRNRPFYPYLASDGQVDKGGKDSNGEGCQKHFLKYGKQALTGGLMVVWCTHSVCYGFHHIPMAEGRNEVFSAIYAHWEKAPEIVIYDFACNLEPYCMTREPDFFADTTFLIDKFHAPGHSKCGKASFVNTYVAANPSLMDVNSSAAECGNGGIHRIRKSVSYMTQENAIIYTKIFLSYWNRAQIRAMIDSQRKHGRLPRD